jgi:hypothetical protein
VFQGVRGEVRLTIRYARGCWDIASASLRFAKNKRNRAAPRTLTIAPVTWI